jgi:hypothetical protein
VIREIRDSFLGPAKTYEVTVPSDGTLVGRLTWDITGNGPHLMLTLGDVGFFASPPDQPLVVGRVEVLAGQTYRISVEESYAFWDYFDNPFVLTISLE